MRQGLKMVPDAEPDIEVVAEAADGSEAVDRGLVEDIHPPATRRPCDVPSISIVSWLGTIRGVVAGKSYVERLPLDSVKMERGSSTLKINRSSGSRSRASKRSKSPLSCASTSAAVRRRLRLMIEWLGPGRSGYGPFKAAS